MKRLRTLFVAALALAIGIAPATGNRVAAQTLAPYELPAISSLTGPIAFGGKEQQQTLQIIEGIVNKTGGIQGHPLKITLLDDQSNPQVAVQLANQLIAKGVPIFLGPIFTATCAAVAPLVEKSGPVSYCFSPGYLPSRGSFVFAPGANNQDQAYAFLRFFRTQRWNRVALLMTTDATGQAFQRGFEVAMSVPENNGLTIVANESMNAADITVSAQLQRIKAARPDVIFFSGSGPPYGTMLRGIAEAALESVPICSSTANMTYGSMEQYKSVLPKEAVFAGVRGLAYLSSPPGPVHDAQGVYYNAFKAAGIRTDGVNELPWDLTWIVVGTLRKLGVNATAAQIHDYIENLHGWAGVNGVYDFGSRDQKGVQDNAVVMYHWDAAKADFIPISGPAGGPLRK
jgi:branched-chain amino acid transport system substrate-binding protein